MHVTVPCKRPGSSKDTKHNLTHSPQMPNTLIKTWVAIKTWLTAKA